MIPLNECVGVKGDRIRISGRREYHAVIVFIVQWNTGYSDIRCHFIPRNSCCCAIARLATSRWELLARNRERLRPWIIRNLKQLKIAWSWWLVASIDGHWDRRYYFLRTSTVRIYGRYEIPCELKVQRSRRKMVLLRLRRRYSRKERNNDAG
jgi:hypothetical protein